MITPSCSQNKMYVWFVPEYKTFYPYDMNIMEYRGVDEFTFTPGSVYAFTTEKKLMKLFNKQRKSSVFVMREIDVSNPMYSEIVQKQRRNLELLKLRSRSDEIEMVVTAGERILLAAEECNIRYHRYMPVYEATSSFSNEIVHILNDKYLDAIWTIRTMVDSQDLLIDLVSLFIGIFGETLRDGNE